VRALERRFFFVMCALYEQCWSRPDGEDRWKSNAVGRRKSFVNDAAFLPLGFSVCA
jgi:hypothetical protein